MKKSDFITLSKKTAKMGGVICVAAGAVAIMTSKAGLQMVLEGGKYFKNTVMKIINGEHRKEDAFNEPVEMAHEEPAAESENLEETDTQKVPVSEENV